MSRSLVSIDVSVEREDGIPTLHCLCDCGTLTHVVLANLASSIAASGLQFAYTCDSCQSSHWLTLTPRRLRHRHTGAAMSEQIEYSAAAELARRVRARVPGWTETTDQPGHWRWTDPDPDYDGRYVEIDGRTRDHVPVADPMVGSHVGPQLLGYNSQVTCFVVLPNMVDRTDLRTAMEVAEVIGALPADARQAGQEPQP